jgi:hypothetical protein
MRVCDKQRQRSDDGHSFDSKSTSHTCHSPTLQLSGHTRQRGDVESGSCINRALALRKQCQRFRLRWRSLGLLDCGGKRQPEANRREAKRSRDRARSRELRRRSLSAPIRSHRSRSTKEDSNGRALESRSPFSVGRYQRISKGDTSSYRRKSLSAFVDQQRYSTPALR